jgi:tetratricopeptide (TPR) repeat protein
MSILDSIFGKKAKKQTPAQTPPTPPIREISSKWKVGDKIANRYEIHQILGGGMGVVYICYDHQERGPLALKTFQDRYLGSPQMRDRFVREAETWVALEKHQNIVKAIAVQNFHGKPYITLEYIANPDLGGADLGRWIRRGLEVPQVLNFAVQFCDGMDYAHKKVGMVHRDIKPGNILVTQDKVVKITDFGLVKTALSEASGEDFQETAGEEAVSDGVAFTRTGAAMGTPPYMSPEQCRNAKEVDIRSDIYAFGAVLFEMLTGRWVFNVTTPAAFVRCHLAESPPSPRTVVPDLPRDLEALVLRCLAKDPGERYPDFAALRVELAKIYHTLIGEELAPTVEGEALEAWEWSNKGGSLAELGHHEEAFGCYDRALALDPSHVNAWVNKGTSLDGLGRWEEALACYDRALALDPRDAKAYYNKGVALDKLGRRAEALVCIDRALAINPRYAKAWDNKGISLDDLGRREEALACFDRALALDPRYAKAWDNKGAALGALGRPEEALACFDRALALDPRYAKAWDNKGVALGALGRLEEALACFDRALALDPGFAHTWDDKGKALDDLGRREEALGCYDRALALDPSYVDAYYNKGVILANSGRFQEALDCFTKALAIDPSYVKAWSNKGVALDALGRRAEALVCIDRALALDPSYARAWYNRGVALANSGRFREALDCFTKVLEIDSSDEGAKQAIALCRQRLKT